jgi:hypothetical protein
MKVIYFVFGLIILASCSHVNDISIDKIKNEKFYFEFKNAGNNGNVVIDFKENVEPKSDNLIIAAAEIIGDLTVNLGTALSAGYMENKLNNSLRNVGVKDILIDDFRNTLIKFGNIKVSESINDNYKYINTINLEKYEILTNDNGIFLTMEISADIKDRESAKIIWADRESKVIKLDLEDESLRRSGKKINEIKQIIVLALISEDKITNALNNATKSISKEFTDTIIKDLQ